jgi:hypothetical protein
MLLGGRDDLVARFERKARGDEVHTVGRVPIQRDVARVDSDEGRTRTRTLVVSTIEIVACPPRCDRLYCQDVGLLRLGLIPFPFEIGPLFENWKKPTHTFEIVSGSHYLLHLSSA